MHHIASEKVYSHGSDPGKAHSVGDQPIEKGGHGCRTSPASSHHLLFLFRHRLRRTALL
jgi:hypothetical protein